MESMREEREKYLKVGIMITIDHDERRGVCIECTSSNMFISQIGSYLELNVCEIVQR